MLRPFFLAMADFDGMLCLSVALIGFFFISFQFSLLDAFCLADLSIIESMALKLPTAMV